MGGRMARGSSLSDDQVINKLNHEFIAVDNNISDQGWPANTPALDQWHNWLDNHPSYAHNGFTTSVVISPDGRMALGTSGSGHVAEWHTSICYDPAKYFGFLEGAEQKFQQYREIASIPDPNQRYQMAVQLQRQVMMENRSRQHPEAAMNPDRM
jgi:hypothetical protein